MKGEVLVLTSGILNSLLPIFASPKAVSISPLWMTTIGSVFSALVFLVLVVLRGKLKELNNIQALSLACLAGIVNGGFYIAIIYVGSNLTSSQNTAVLITFEAFASAFLLRKINNEQLNQFEAISGSLLILSMALLLLPSTTSPNIGDLLVIIGCCIAPIGNIFMKKARAIISTTSVLFIRSTVGSLALLAISLTLSTLPKYNELSNALPIILLNGLLVLTLTRLLWLEGIMLIPIAKANIIASSTPLLTFLFAWISFSEIPSLLQVVSAFICISALILILSKSTAKGKSTNALLRLDFTQT